MIVLPVLLLLAACGGSAPVPTAMPDETLQRQLRVARLALEGGRFEESARIYATALTRARERDSGADIAEAATGRATAQLSQGQARAARDTTEETMAELRRRHAPLPATLLLATATARFQDGDPAGAVEAARIVLQGSHADAKKRAWFLLGLIAARAGDAAALAEAQAGLGEAGPQEFRADAAELAAEAALLRGDRPAALDRAQGAAELRQAILDYRGLTRALRLAARAAPTDQAGDYLLRAARGAAARREVETARGLFAEAGRASAALAPIARRESAALTTP